MKIAICDDEKNICIELEDLLTKNTEDKGIIYDIDIFDSGKALCKELKETNYDLIFLDIELLDLDGVKVGKFIRENLRNEAVQIAYISSKKEYAMELFDYRPINFLVKPISKESIEKVINKCLTVNSQKHFTFSYKKGCDFYKVEFSKILYFEKDGRRIKITTKDKEDIFYGRMEEVYEQLDGKEFLFIHKSVIVNYNYISRMKYESLIMMDGKEFSISQSRRKEIRKKFAILRKREEKGV